MMKRHLVRFLPQGIGLALILLALASCSASPPLGVSPAPPRTSTAPASTSVSLLHPTQQLHPTSRVTITAPPPPSTAAPTLTAGLPEITPPTQTPATSAAHTPTSSPTTSPQSPAMSPSPAPMASPQPAAPQPAPTTSPSPAPTAPSAPQVLSFTIAPTITQNLGDQIVMAWEATGQAAAVCPLIGSGPVESDCQDVPLQGELTFTTDEASMAYLGFALRVTGDSTVAWSAVNTHLQCRDLRPWFFDDPPERCPAGPALHSYAAGQYFEHGFMVWVEDTDEFYIFYQGQDQAGFQIFERLVGLQLKPNASQDNRVPEEPPPGYLQPVSGFGMLWRGEVENLSTDVRQRLGWATAPEFGFDTAYQCATRAHPRSWSCYLRGPSGEPLHLHPDSTAQIRLLWETQ